ncbi:MAG: putative ABC transporter permease [Lachnospiraceae bacterium]|nr:putative ABC transporter permease [Lachnospiraceae bacterium]
MKYTIFEMILLFYAYSFFGWCAESTVTTIRKKQFKNRGFINGPFCFIYGFTGFLLTFFLQELRLYPIFLYLGCMIIATATEWYTGKNLEKLNHKKWWDYSNLRFNVDGYICLRYSLLWGLFGFLAVYYVNDQLIWIFRYLPSILQMILSFVLLIGGGLDLLCTIAILLHLEKYFVKAFQWNKKLHDIVDRFGLFVSNRTKRRIREAYSLEKASRHVKRSPDALGAFDMFWLFILGAVGGDLFETVFCRLKAGVWMSRSSLVIGPFSIVWGFAVMAFIMLLYKNAEKSDSSIFAAGVLLGAAYEYICSVFSEIVFGTIFWDYSNLPFNLGGRINLLYCFFWGIAAWILLKFFYPHMRSLILWIRKKTGVWLTVIFFIFMLFDFTLSGIAMVRYVERSEGVNAENEIEQKVDDYYTDAKMERIYPNMKIVK